MLFGKKNFKFKTDCFFRSFYVYLFLIIKYQEKLFFILSIFMKKKSTPFDFGFKL